MKRKLLSLSLALVLLTTAAPVALMQSQASDDVQDWQALDGLKPGTEILIEFKGGRRDPTVARFFGFAGRSLIVVQDDVKYSVPQRDIQRVSLKAKWSRDRMAKIGAGIGMLVGVAIGAKLAVDFENANPGVANAAPAYGGMFIGALAGAAVGALAGKRRGKLVYEAK